MRDGPSGAASHDLVIPDPRQHPVPPGWLENIAVPAILAVTEWAVLDEYESRLRAFASYIESFNGDALEFEKALRVVEKRRADLLEPPKQGERNDLLQRAEKVDLGASDATISSWRKIGRNWDKVWPIIREADNRFAVTQSAVLRTIKTGVHYSSNTGEWSTPDDLFDLLDAEFHFTLDVCATLANTKCGKFFTEADDGLAQDWSGSCWMNPPYGDVIPKWIQKAWESSFGDATVVCLVPARVDTGWWWDYCRFGEIRFLRGRLKFGGGDTAAPFPSAVVIFPREPTVTWWER